MSTEWPCGLRRATIPVVIVACIAGAINAGDADPPRSPGVPSVPSPAASAAAPAPTSRAGVAVTIRRLADIPRPADGEPANAAVARIARRLTDTRLDLELDEASARDALAALSEAVGVPIVARYTSERVANGIDGDTKLIVRLTDVTLQDALQAVIDRCRTSSPATWQIVDGTIDVGPKAWLARSSARVHRVYDVQALLLEAPYSMGPPLQSILGSGALQPGPANRALPEDIPPTPLERWAERKGFKVRMDPNDTAPQLRKPPILIAAELIDFVKTAIEPEAWRPTDAQEQRRRERDSDNEGDPLVCHGQWASISYRDGHLVVTAPDYVHRALAGYGR